MDRVPAGIAGIVGIQSSLTLDAAYDDTYTGDAEAITQRMSELVAAHAIWCPSPAGLRRPPGRAFGCRAIPLTQV